MGTWWARTVRDWAAVPDPVDQAHNPWVLGSSPSRPTRQTWAFALLLIVSRVRNILCWAHVPTWLWNRRESRPRRL